MKESILSIIKARVRRETFDHFCQSLDCDESKTLAVSFTSCFRVLGKDDLNPSSKELKVLSEIGDEIDWSLWRTDDLGRLLVVTQGLAVDENFVGLIEKYFDLQEAIAVARILPLLPQPERFVALAQENCRTNSESLFQAMAWGNPYPGRFFDELSFNHMVLKALFLNVSLKPIIGLRHRMNQELIRMVSDYCQELRSASRELPQDIEMVLDHKVESV